MRRLNEKTMYRQKRLYFSILCSNLAQKNYIVRQIRKNNLRKHFEYLKSYTSVHQKMRIFCTKIEDIFENSYNNIVLESFDTCLRFSISKDHNNKEEKYYEYKSLLDNTYRNLNRAQNLMNKFVDKTKGTDYVSQFFIEWKR